MVSPDVDFRTLYAQHLDFVWRNLRALGVPTADLDDATQDTFVVAFRRREELRPGASMRAWLYGVARRVAYRQRRGGKRRGRLKDAVAAEPHEPTSLQAKLEHEQTARLALELLDGLPPVQREAYWLSEIEGLTATQVGQAVGISGNTVSSRLRAARQTLARRGQNMQARERGELQRALRGHAGPSSQRRREMAVAIAAQIASPALGSPLLGTIGPWIVGAVASAALVVGVTSWTTASSGSESPATPGPSLARGPQRTAPEAPPQPPTLQLPQPKVTRETASSSITGVPATPVETSKSARRRATTQSPQRGSLLEEAQMLREVKASVSSSPSQALALLDEYSRRFPDGSLRVEASALRVRAACAQGDPEQAAEAAHALPPHHAWADGCREHSVEEKATNPPGTGEEGGI